MQNDYEKAQKYFEHYYEFGNIGNGGNVTIAYSRKRNYAEVKEAIQVVNVTIGVGRYAPKCRIIKLIQASIIRCK